MLNRPKNSTNSTQAVISTDQNFILAKNIGNFTDIISPFKKIKENNYSSKFILPISQLHRIQTLYDSISSISQYTVIDNTIKFDCVSNLPSDMFGDSTEGYIHFSAVKQHKKDKVEVVVDPKMVFQLIDCEPDIFIYNQKIKFKSDFLKAFPIILRPGFMFSTVNKTICQLFISIINPKEMLVGECSKYEIINVIQYVLPLWPIFDINIGKSIKIKLQSEFIQDRYSDESSPILLYISYNLEKPEEITIGKIARNVNID
jgi:hypothetical protein